MRKTTRELRGAYIKLLSGLSYKGAVLPVKSGMLNGKGAVITIGDGNFEAFINIINEYRQGNDIKNGMSHLAYLTIDINTVFEGSSYNFAGEEWVEEITDLVYDRLFEDYNFRLKEFGINNDRFIVTSTDFFENPMPVQYNESSRIFRSVISFEHTIHHMKTPVSEPLLWIKTIDNV